jgi:hypothetical protein
MTRRLGAAASVAAASVFAAGLAGCSASSEPAPRRMAGSPC